MLSYWGYQAITALSRVLPRGLQYAAAHRLADLHYLLDCPARKAVRANLRVILGPEASEALLRNEARWVFRSFGRYLCEFLGHHRFGAAYLDRHVVVNGREHLDRALEAGRGCLFVSGHYSNWELGAFVVGRLGYPIVALTQVHKTTLANELFVRQRARHGVTVIHTHKGARAILRHLRKNHPVAILGDRSTGGPAVPVTLFGRRTALPQGPWRLALDTGAPLLPTFVQRRFHGGYTLSIGAPLLPPGAGSRAQRRAALAQAWAQKLEAWVRSDPSQWAVFYPLWPAPEEKVQLRPRSIIASTASAPPAPPAPPAPHTPPALSGAAPRPEGRQRA